MLGLQLKRVDEIGPRKNIGQKLRIHAIEQDPFTLAFLAYALQL